jgi:hypothetical protein
MAEDISGFSAQAQTVADVVEGFKTRTSRLFRMFETDFHKHVKENSATSDHCAACALSAPFDPHFVCRCKPAEPFRKWEECDTDKRSSKCNGSPCLYKVKKPLLSCGYCPRVYHVKCLPGNSKFKQLAASAVGDVNVTGNFACPECLKKQHVQRHGGVCLECADFVYLIKDIARLLGFLSACGVEAVDVWMSSWLADVKVLLELYRSHRIRHFVQGSRKTEIMNGLSDTDVFVIVDWWALKYGMRTEMMQQEGFGQGGRIAPHGAALFSRLLPTDKLPEGVAESSRAKMFRVTHHTIFTDQYKKNAWTTALMIQATLRQASLDDPRLRQAYLKCDNANDYAHVVLALALLSKMDPALCGNIQVVLILHNEPGEGKDWVDGNCGLTNMGLRRERAKGTNQSTAAQVSVLIVECMQWFQFC